LLLAMISIQSGSALAKGLFDVISPVGLAFLRLALAAAVLLPITRPRWRQYRWQDYRWVVGLGVSVGAMNALLYSAIAHIPLGVAVTLEFVGPLGVALAHARRPVEGLWVGLAAVGLVLLAPWQTGVNLAPVGVMLALASGGCWGLYILLAARVSQIMPGSGAVAIAMAAGALAVLPIAVAQEGTRLLSPSLLGLGLGVAILASALPYSLEMAAIRQVPVRVFGVLMSLEPVVATSLGFVMLGEQISLRVALAIALVSFAAAGSALSQSPPPAAS
jgi:inner membrane transporter RhtA